MLARDLRPAGVVADHRDDRDGVRTNAARRPGSGALERAGSLSLQAPIRAEVSKRFLGVSQLLVQPSRVEVGVCKPRIDGQASLVAVERGIELPSILERDGQVEMQLRHV